MFSLNNILVNLKNRSLHIQTGNNQKGFIFSVVCVISLLYTVKTKNSETVKTSHTKLPTFGY